MAGIVPTLESDYIVAIFSKIVGDLSLSFITPLCANNNSNLMTGCTIYQSIILR